MVDTFQLLKQEIMQTMESEHDFAKWKLIVVAALGATALGLGKGGLASSESAHSEIWLLLAIPFACAYVDSQSYQYLNRIIVIARFIREYGKQDATMDKGDRAMQDYEEFCAQARGERAFSLGAWARLAVSLIASVVAAVAFFRLGRPVPGLVTGSTKIMWGVAFLLIVLLWCYHKYYSLPRIEQLPVPSGATKASGA